MAFISKLCKIDAILSRLSDDMSPEINSSELDDFSIPSFASFSSPFSSQSEASTDKLDSSLGSKKIIQINKD